DNKVSDKANTDYEEIITTVRDVFDLPEDLSNVQISQYNGRTNISWSYDNGGREYNITADEHGCVTKYSSYDRRDYSESRSMGLNEKIGKPRAQKIAERVIAALYGEAAADFICENTNIDSTTVDFTYYCTQNGIKIDDPVNISVNRLTGDISYFYGLCGKVFTYEYPLPEKSKLIDSERLLASYKENDRFQLVYHSFYDITGKRYTKPVYIITPSFINAFDGSLVSEGNDYYDEGLGYAADAEEDAAYSTAATEKRVTEFEKQAIEEYKNLIDEKKADSILKQYFPELKDYTLEDSYIYWYDDMPVIDISYEPQDKKTYVYAGADLNAKTGEVISYYNYKPFEEKDEEAKPDAKKKAEITEKTFKALAPDIYKSGDFTAETEDDSFYVEFGRYANGIRVDDQYVMVGLNTDYTVSMYNKNWYETEFPALDDVIDESSIFDAAAKDNELGLKYLIVKEKPVLAYGLDSNDMYYSYNLFYDAKTGQHISSYDGEPYEKTADGKYTDLENSPYRETIETLSEYGYRLPYTEFEPDKPITVEDFCTFLSYPAEYMTYDDKPLYSESQLDKNVTKYDIAAILVDAEGYTELARKDIFVDNFDDVDAKYKGTVAIAAAMGLIFEKQGKFNGTQTVTRGQAAEYIYNVLAVHNML
ncbi:MAG: S-layer homology domain-containing protein, partial [Firmicutes bacterium]|nr:S-layer homology domain-containing protein [Bacillota bacterium]